MWSLANLRGTRDQIIAAINDSAIPEHAKTFLVASLPADAAALKLDAHSQQLSPTHTVLSVTIHRLF